MVSWFVDQYKEAMFIISFTLAELFMISVALIGFSLTHIIYKKDTFFVNKVNTAFQKIITHKKDFVWQLYGSYCDP